jgi:PKD repeat protein
MSTEYPVFKPTSTTNVRPSTNVGRFSTRTRLRTRGRSLYRKQINTKTLFGAFIGVFISYFVLTARGEDSPQNTQPESLYRYEAPDLPPEKTLENSDPAREGVVVTDEKIEATAAEADAMIKSLSRSRPGAHVSVQPAATKAAVKAEDAARGVKSQKEESATAKKEKKGGIFSRIANKLRGRKGKKDKDDAAASAATEAAAKAGDAKVAEAADETKEATGDAKVAEAADETKEAAGDAKVAEAADGAKESATEKAEAAKPVRPTGRPWSPNFVVDSGEGAPVQPQVRPTDGLDQTNTVTRRSLPSPQDKNCRTFTFDATGSKDADEDKLTYEWDFGDTSKKSDAVRVRHTFPESGEYKVTLIVSDHTGGQCETDTRSQLLYVNSAPIAVGTFPVELNANENGLFDARLSEDAQNDRLAYKWEFGDGTTSDEPVTSHSYKQPGEYRVILTVKDDSGTQCDTNVVSSMVSVNKPLLRKPIMALAEPNPVRPIQEVPEAVIISKDDGEQEQNGLLVQIRDHEGPIEEEEIAIDTARPKEEIRQEKPLQPGLQFASIPIPEFIEARPDTQDADPQLVPQTHKYILAWAGGYMVDGPPIDCCDENKISFRKRTATHIERLLKTVDSGRNRLNLLEVSDQEKARILAERTQDIAALDVKIDNVRTESRTANKNAVVKLKKDFNELRDDHENTSQKLFSIAARNADAIRDTASETAQHQKDNNRHKAGASRKSPGETPQAVNPDNYRGLSIPSEGQ